jgi:hypothetical protein
LQEKTHISAQYQLKAIVRPCSRKSRTNPLSHQPGGSDVVVAYSLGDAILYDWIKNVDWYISSFERDRPGFHQKIESIYGRFYEDESERRIGVFCTIWNRDKEGGFQDAIKACVKRYQRQMDIGHKTLHEEAQKYWKSYGLSDQEVENLPTIYKQYMTEKAEFSIHSKRRMRSPFSLSRSAKNRYTFDQFDANSIV